MAFTDHNAAELYLRKLAPPAPEDVGLKAWSCNPLITGSFTTPFGVSGRQLLTRLWLPAGVVTNFHFGVRTAGAGLTTGQSFVGLYNASGAQVAVSGDAVTAFGTTGYKTLALASPYTAAEGFFYAAFLSVYSTTSPAFAAPIGSNGGGVFSGLGTSTTRLFYIDATTRTALPASYTLSGLSAAGDGPWVGVS